MDVSSRVKKKTHKYGIEVSENVLGIYILDKGNVNDYWRKAIAK